MLDLAFPTSFAHRIEFGLDVDQFADFKESATRLASAYNKSVGIFWAAYSTYAGPSTSVYVLIPIERLEKLDEIPSVDAVLFNEYGEAARVFLLDYQRAVKRISTSILSYVPSARGRELEWGPTMPAYIYYSRLTIRGGEFTRFRKASEIIACAHREHTDGLPWHVYSTLAGDPVVHCLLPLRKLGDLKIVQNNTRVVLDAHGHEAGAAALDDFQNSISDSRSAVLQYMGHFPG